MMTEVSLLHDICNHTHKAGTQSKAAERKGREQVLSVWSRRKARVKLFHTDTMILAFPFTNWLLGLVA